MKKQTVAIKKVITDELRKFVQSISRLVDETSLAVHD
jgi:uncharacterized protein (UPF0335 family)